MTEVKDDLEKRMDINLTPVNNNFSKELLKINLLYFHILVKKAALW